MTKNDGDLLKGPHTHTHTHTHAHTGAVNPAPATASMASTGGMSKKQSFKEKMRALKEKVHEFNLFVFYIISLRREK